MDINRTEPIRTFCKLLEEEFGLAIDKNYLTGKPSLIVQTTENDIYVYISDGKHYADQVVNAFDLRNACAAGEGSLTLIHIARGFFDHLLRAQKHVKEDEKYESPYRQPSE